MRRLGPDQRAFFDSAYQGIAPWDVGKAQPALVALLDARRWFFSRRGISEEGLRARFTAKEGWRIHEMRPAEFQTVRMPMPAIRVCIERLPAPPP